MTLDWLLEAVTDDPPCGPDLADADDDAFDDYYYAAEARLPERYFTPGHASAGRGDQLFDPRSVQLSDERSAIAALLERTRDLRLLALLARFQILAGHLVEFVDTLEAMVALLGTWRADLHPQHDRRAALETLAEQTTVVMPLHYVPLLAATDVTLRRHLVATGRATPRGDEADIVDQDVLAPLRGDTHKGALRNMQEVLTRAATALAVLSSRAAMPEAGLQPADLSATVQTIKDMQAMITEVWPDLPGWSAAEAEPDPADALPEAVGPVPAAPAAAACHIADRDAARVALSAAEKYLAHHSPSSPALLLIAQARQLVGASLVEALELLLPSEAAQAVLSVGREHGFQLPMERMKSLSGAALEAVAVSAAEPRPPKIGGMADLLAQLAGVEAYYKRNEPASPIPLLLARARDMTGKNFNAIISELFSGGASDGS